MELNKQLEKEILKLRIAIEKETNKDIKKILIKQKKYLEQMRKEVGSIYMKYVDDENNLNLNYSDKFNEMKKIEKNIIDMRKIITTSTITITYRTLTRSYVNGYYKTANIINSGVEVGINYKLLRPEFVDAVINANFEDMVYSDRIWKNTDKLANELYNTIGKGITEGTSIQKLSKEIKDAFDVSSYNAYRLVNTETARVVTNATEEIYKDSGVVDKMMWCATLEGDRTCEDCQGLDGQVFDLKDTTKPDMPKHPNCRCTWIPVIDGWNPKVRRDQDTKGNIPYTDFKSWAKDNNIND